ncbi:MAG: 4-oxalocrotonate tautomerase [Ancylobacter novellus]|uniref:4-oxalocrotonate tautomerase n=1 Tax=Ancylobacter novellus TaxID=921 RepID=A0A2W5QR73_ANCNO|nr:MAG: 4-oxalocrotonate tautomerase [Ancylobacter novellus]
MPFINVKVPQRGLSRAQKESVVHGITAVMVDILGEAARPATLVLVEEVPDGGYGRGDEILIIPDSSTASPGTGVE